MKVVFCETHSFTKTLVTNCFILLGLALTFFKVHKLSCGWMIACHPAFSNPVLMSPCEDCVFGVGGVTQKTWNITALSFIHGPGLFIALKLFSISLAGLFI